MQANPVSLYCSGDAFSFIGSPLCAASYPSPCPMASTGCCKEWPGDEGAARIDLGRCCRTTASSTSPTTTASSDLEREEGSSHRWGTPGPPRFLDRCDALHDGRPKILRPQEASGGSGASPAKSGQIQWKNSPPARPSDQAPIAEPNGRHAAGELLAVSLLIRTDFFLS